MRLPDDAREVPPARPPQQVRRRPLSTREAAAFLGVAPATLRDWHRQGLVRPRRRNAWDVVELRDVQRNQPRPRRPDRVTAGAPLPRPEPSPSDVQPTGASAQRQPTAARAATTARSRSSGTRV